LQSIMADTEIRDRIKQTAHDLIMQYGIRSVSMDDIAAKLGISKKTIYQYFADKDALVEEVINDRICFNQDCCSKDKLVAKDAVHEVFLAIQMMQDMFENMNPGIIHDMEKFHPSAYQKFQQYKYSFLYSTLKENIERGIREELFRNDFQIDVIVKARLECLMLSFNQQVFPKSKFKLVDIETQLAEHYLFGLATQKGHKLIVKYQQERLKKTNSNEKNNTN